MPLKTLVKAGNITNLSEARYCAGMGVDFLGITVIRGRPGYLSPELFQEIRGWVSGPKIVAELYGINDISILDRIIGDYAADFVELSFSEHKTFGHRLPLPQFVKVTGADIPLITQPEGSVSYWIADEGSLPALDRNDYVRPVLCSIRGKDSVKNALEDSRVKGIVLNGTDELRPGFIDYDVLADVLESLEE